MTGYKKTLTKQDLWSIDENETCDHLTIKLEKEWNKAADKYIKLNRIKYEEFQKQQTTARDQANGQTVQTEIVNEKLILLILTFFIIFFKGI